MPDTLAADEIVGNADVDVADGILDGAIFGGATTAGAAISTIDSTDGSTGSLMLTLFY